VHAHQYTPFFYATLARGLRMRFPILFTEHGRHFPDCPSRKRRLYNRICLRRRDRVVGVGRAVEEALVIKEGIPERRVEVIYNGVSLERRTDSTAAIRSEVRSALNLAAHQFVIIQVARLDYLKDHRTAIDALTRLVVMVPEATLLLVGDGPERSGIEREIEMRGLGRHVRLLGVRRDVERLLASADVFLLTSISEGIPVTLIEAMAAGLPVVSTDVGGVAEIVRDGETGFLAQAHDGHGLAESLKRLADDVPLRAAMGQRGLARAHERFSDRQMHNAYARLYRQMAHN
jgi:glycosyltransferase involved in cell wall biosynthesis